MTQLTIGQVLHRAAAHHQAGRFAEAEALYRQILARDPVQPDALHLLGLLALQHGQHAVAADYIGRALAREPEFPEAHNSLGNVLRGQGRLDDAIASYQRALAIWPDFPDALVNLGNACQAKGRYTDAVDHYRHALAANPGSVEAHNNLGLLLRAQGRLEEAAASFRQALNYQPACAEAHNNLGVTLRALGLVEQAISSYEKALATKPDYIEALTNLANARKAQGQFDQAVSDLQRALVLFPNNLEMHVLLANALLDTHRPDEAMTLLQRALSLRPDSPEVHAALGNAHQAKRQPTEAIAAFQKAQTLKPDWPELLNNLGNAYKDLERLDLAIPCLRRAIHIKPNWPEVHRNLANTLKELGQLDEAILEYRTALTLRPSYAEAHSGIILTQHYHPASTAQGIYNEARRWNEAHALPLNPRSLTYPNDRSPDRPLRIGYVSADFNHHACSFFLKPLFEHHDHKHFTVFAYSQVVDADAHTRHFEALVDHWHPTASLSDADLADLIRKDRIDILVDLSQHTGGNRLLVFARKPAPIQLTWLGYPGTTGLTAIDYRLTDPYLAPPPLPPALPASPPPPLHSSADDTCYSEQSVRLPDSFWCFDPWVDSSLPALQVNPLPALTAGHITFGSLNNFCKLNAPLLAIWSRLLQGIPRSRLVLLAPPTEARESRQPILDALSIDPGRVDFVSRRPRRDYLELHHRLDLFLDTSPFNGATTTLNALWMGLPVITLSGATAVGRAGTSLLRNLNLSELIAQTPDQYVQIASDLAGDLPRLAALRSSLRSRLEQSPLMDGPRFARNMEATYRSLWQRDCMT